ncbi:hypothetical protein SH449x_002295 [Pirellulaceae bacterium SH449]
MQALIEQLLRNQTSNPTLKLRFEGVADTISAVCGANRHRHPEQIPSQGTLVFIGKPLSLPSFSPFRQARERGGFKRGA